MAGVAIAVAAAGALWIFAATFYGQMQKTSDWHMAGPTEAMMFAVCAHVTHTYTRVAGVYEIDVSASRASCVGPGGYLGSDDSAGRRTVETPAGRAVLGDYEQPEARVDTPTTSLIVGSLSDRIVPDDVFADFLRSLQAVSAGA